MVSNVTKSVGFIGPGKVGCSLGRHISENGGDGFAVCGYFGRDREAALAAAAFAGGRAFSTAEELAGECDLLLLTVPDGQIADVWARLRAALPAMRAGESRQLFVGHCSGSLDSRVFREEAPVMATAYSVGNDGFDPRVLGAYASGTAEADTGVSSGLETRDSGNETAGPARAAFGSIHPLVAVFDRENAYKRLAGAYFTLEGDEAFSGFAGELLSKLGNPFRTIDAAQKTLYHAASVMVSNLVCALAWEGMEMFKACGFDAGFAESAWKSLFLGNAENIDALGPVSALTGPVERGDAATVARHLDALPGDAREIYRLLSRELVKIAKQKNPGRDYAVLELLLEKGKQL